MKQIKFSKKELEILSDCIVNQIRDIQQYKYIKFTDNKKFDEYDSILTVLFKKVTE